VKGRFPDEEPGLFLIDRETGNLYSLSTMNDEEGQETPFQEMTPNHWLKQQLG
jgi:hypothetical protein